MSFFKNSDPGDQSSAGDPTNSYGTWGRAVYFVARMVAGCSGMPFSWQNSRSLTETSGVFKLPPANDSVTDEPQSAQWNLCRFLSVGAEDCLTKRVCWRRGGGSCSQRCCRSFCNACLGAKGSQGCCSAVSLRMVSARGSPPPLIPEPANGMSPSDALQNDDLIAVLLRRMQ